MEQYHQIRQRVRDAISAGLQERGYGDSLDARFVQIDNMIVDWEEKHGHKTEVSDEDFLWYSALRVEHADLRLRRLFQH